MNDGEALIKEVSEKVALLEQAYERIVKDVKTTNGRRRARILTPTEVWDDIIEALKSPYQFDHAGHVANCYGSAAYATALVLVYKEPHIYWAVRTVNATKGSTGFGRVSSYINDILHPEMNWQFKLPLPMFDLTQLMVAADALEEKGDSRADEWRYLAKQLDGTRIGVEESDRTNFVDRSFLFATNLTKSL